MDLDNLATICANIIRAQGLSTPDSILVGSKIIIELSKGGVAVSAPLPIDNKPNLTASPAQPQEPPKVLLPPGKSCYCRCGKEIYKTGVPVTDRMPTKDFIKAFVPQEGAKPLTLKSKMQFIDGNLTIDCETCGKELGVCLMGEFPPPDNDALSFTDEELGLDE
jgi:hypothetical protein